MKQLILTLMAALWPMLSMSAASWQRLTTANGLTNNQTRQAICLPDGRMVVVVEGMINLYDGQQFYPLELDRTLTADINSFLNTNHYLDPKGNLWIRTLHQLVAIDSRQRALNVREMLQRTGIRGKLQNFFIDSDGAAWLHVSGDSLMRYDWQEPAQLMMRTGTRQADGLQTTICNIIEADRLHYILFSNGEMACFDSRKRKTVKTWTLSDAAHGSSLMNWMVAPHCMLIRSIVDGKNRILRFDTQKRCIADTVWDERLHDFMVDRKGRIWAHNQQHICRIDSHLRVLEEIEPAPFGIGSFVADHQGGLWACTSSDGLLYHSGVHAHLVYSSPFGGSSADAMLVGADGKVLVGTANGVFVQESPHGPWHAVDGLQQFSVTHLAQAPNGHIYLSTRGSGLVECDNQGNIYDHSNMSQYLQMYNRVEFCTPLPHGRCLINADMNQLLLATPRTQQVQSLMNRLGNSLQDYRRIIDALPLDNGWLMATQNGLFFLALQGDRFRADKQRFATLADNPWSVKCNCLFRSRDGSIYVGTQNGLLRYQEKHNQLRRYTTDDGLSHNTVLSIVDDSLGRLWMATMQGICRLDPATGEAISYGLADGVEDLQFVERAAVRTPDGHLIFGTRGGIYTIQPDSMQLPQLELAPRLLALHVADSIMHPSGDEPIRLAHDQNFLSFTLSTLNYAYASHTRFRYRLHGIDSDWLTRTGQGDKLVAAYTALPPGKYRFEAQAALQGGEWGRSVCIDVTIRPPLWQTWWAYLIYIVLVLTIAYYIGDSYRQRKLMRQRIDELLRESERPLPQPQAPMEPQTEENVAEDNTEDKKEITPADRRFLEKAIGCIDRNMANAEYSIDAFASDMAMERSTLYRRLQSVIGQAPLEFVRTIRLKRAAELLRSGKYSVTEVSELVGYNTPRYFTKHFRDIYGVRPSEYR